MTLIELKDGNIENILVKHETKISGYCDTCYHEYEVSHLTFEIYDEDGDYYGSIRFKCQGGVTESKITKILLSNYEKIRTLTIKEFEEQFLDLFYDYY